ncbi:FecR family protein [Sedimentisphaera salicampi]|uniref:FecR protein n=1 Tax=Sedimentisphaera salicampi TaxID=1941349 RepID=A0A1W6LLB1_9BACT|nr:FecR family protein [Sedimentisphaera salicampi]ARN56545.1 FecR protein [Sedimentisphaera salicampi]
MDKKTAIELNFLLAGGMEGGLSGGQRSRLNELLEGSESARSYALEIFRISAGLKKSGKAAEAFQQRPGPEDFTQKFIMNNSIGSPELLRLGRQEPEEDQDQPAECDCGEQRRRVSIPNLILAACSAAALIFLLLWANLAPGSLPSEQVGVLSEVMDVRWAEDAENIPEKGDGVFSNSNPLTLNEGFVEIDLRSGVHLTIESPASFEVISDDQIELKYGNIYASVPKEAVGFQVTTENSKIIDLGTEFGVSQEISGDTEVHVSKGRTTFITRRFINTNNVEVLENTANRFDVSEGRILEVEFQEDKFARRIISEQNIIWRGQPIRLANTVSGGSGLNDINSKSDSIIPGTGEIASHLLLRNYGSNNAEMKDSHFEFHQVESSPFVDGVFVPNGSKGECKVSSKGDIFEDCPPTDGRFWTYICNTQSFDVDYRGKEKQRQRDNFRIISGFSGIFIHPNAGITFDLKPFREITEEKTFRFKFSTLVSPSDSPDNGEADFWVLTDGELRYKRENVTAEMETESEEIYIDENTEFLTLVTTGGESGNGNDRCIFEEPVLIAE